MHAQRKEPARTEERRTEPAAREPRREGDRRRPIPRVEVQDVDDRVPEEAGYGYGV